MFLVLQFHQLFAASDDTFIVLLFRGCICGVVTECLENFLAGCLSGLGLQYFCLISLLTHVRCTTKMSYLT